MASLESRLRRLEVEEPRHLPTREDIELQELILHAQTQVQQVFRRLAQSPTTFGARGARPKTADDRQREAQYLRDLEAAIAEQRQHLAALRAGAAPADARSAKPHARVGSRTRVLTSPPTNPF